MKQGEGSRAAYLGDVQGHQRRRQADADACQKPPSNHRLQRPLLGKSISSLVNPGTQVLW